MIYDHPDISVTRKHIEDDPHGRRKIKALYGSPEREAATERLLASMNRPGAGERMVLATQLLRPALCGVVRDFDDTPAVKHLRSLSKEEKHNWHRAVGVVVKIGMEQMGASTTGKKGAVVNSLNFKVAEIYELAEADKVPPGPEDAGMASAA